MGQRKQAALALGVLILVASVVVALWALSNRGVAHATQGNSPDDPGPLRQGDLIIVPEHSALRTEIRVQAASALEAPHWLRVPATVEADPSRTANILPPVTGNVVELKVRLGDHVTKGQRLAVLASGDFAQASSDLNKARDALQLAKRERDRTRKVFDAGGGASKDVEQAESNYTQALEEYQRVVDRIKAIGGGASGDTHQLGLTSPMSGSVTLLSVAPGAYVNDPTVPIMTISNLDSIWFTAYVPENSVSFVAKGQKVAITLPAYPGEVFNGTV
ncbi:MAG: efflux RND transporter periplasmic adaptor subunit, partial [Thiobacillaceae bacterium]